MSDKVRKLKDDASRFIAKGKLVEATDLYEKIVKADPRDLTARQKLAELYARLGKIKEAVHTYQSVAGSYAADGLLLKAIAVCKIILQIDPSHTETQTILAELSTKRRGESTAVEMPKAMSAALPSGKKSAADIRGVPSQQLVPRQGNIRLDGKPIDVGASAGQPRPSTSPGAPIAAVPVANAAINQPQVIHEVAPKLPERKTDGSDALGRVVNTSVDELQAALAAASAAAGVPVQPDVTKLRDEPTADIAIDVTFDSNEGMPVVAGAVIAPGMSSEGVISVSAEGVPIVETIESAPASLPADLPADLPPDEVISDTEADQLIMDDGAGGDIVELTEPAQVDVDRIPPIPLFSDLPKEAFIALTERMDLRIATNGDVLVQEGERGSSMFVIIQGKVVVKRNDNETGRDIVLAELDDGTFFGEMALLSDAPRVASVVCADDTMLFEISRELLADITQQYPSVGEVMKRFHKNRLLTNLLKTSPIFAPFSAGDKKGLIEKFKSRSVDEGTYLITRERPGEGLYVLLSGRCEVLDTGPEGKEVLLAELKEGDVFGEMSMLWHKKTCASVKAITPCVVLRLPRDQFNEVIMTHPQILETLTALSERRAKQNEELRTPAGNDMLL